ncbi:MAG: LysM peptidoglycan-binding domain-containing protein [Gammaproteobacteria bacterium]|nr:LysM peptidoglycan-binding domain-containing protein [Gammaproteobacteria bacterium]
MPPSRPIHRRLRLLAGPLLMALAALFAPPQAAAHHLVETQEVFCDARFPCSERLKSRINFWVQVFSRWGTDEAVFHDSQFPQRVYAVVKSTGTCARRKKSAVLTAEYQRIKQTLTGLAQNAAAGAVDGLGAEEQHILKLFPVPDAAELRAAAGRIRCQQGNRDRFRAALQRYGAYHGMVQKILRDAGLSPDIQYLPFVESAYNPRAMSRVGAAGLWQIMPRTGRNFGLQVSGAIDERLDPESATRAAARYLKKSEEVLRAAAEGYGALSEGDLNPFIITSYNYGVTGARKSIRQFGPDFDSVLEHYESPRFKIAVKNFYASFLAARHVARDAGRYFSGVHLDAPFQYHTHVLKHAASIERIEKVFNLPQEELRRWNTALTRYVWHGWRFVPAGYRLRLPPKEGGWEKEVKRFTELAPQQENFSNVRYRVKKGDTACAIARAFGVNCRRLMAVNDLNRRGLIRVGQQLTIPSRKPAAPARRVALAEKTPAETAMEKSAQPRKAVAADSETVVAAPETAVAPAQYTVRAGDTPCEIALRYTISCAALLENNDLDRHSKIFPGQVLQVRLVERPAALPAGEALTVDEEEFLAVLDQPPDFAVYETGAAGSDGAGFFIFVLPEETLGHFSDWLNLGFTRRLRKFNDMGSKRSVRIGQRILLPIADRAMIETFERRRQDYHGLLVEEFKETYRVEGLEKYQVARGDSLWTIAREKQIPLWLLLRFNPGLARKQLRASQEVDVPLVAERA